MDATQLQQLITLAGLFLVGGSALAAAALGARELHLRGLRRARLQNGGTAGAFAGPAGGESPLGARLTRGIQRLGQRAAVQDPAKLSIVRMKLMRAGYFNREATAIYLGVRAAAMIAATAGTVLLLPLVVSGSMGPAALAMVLAGAALLGPDQVLSMRRREREQEYTDGFPDLLDLLVASVEAGLSLDAAVSRVTDELVRRYPNLAIHLRFLTLELRAGKARKEAWLAFADRLGIDDARSLATMLRQAEDMGTSLGETLSVFSADMRVKRMLRAEEKALALPAKLTVPLILFIFPCLLGILLLPAVARLMDVLGGQ